ncbi:hypothetical protein IX317_000612 [Fusobacterium sp. DD29]|uniref:DUF3310 domain-containing protein n=1 Tax=unclassified Fusobacterium TaxID=2648384 RepID=UPI001B8D740E|nr:MULTISPECIES: DUF3310 domain-containing protein [unclassified Fusobacterium]MBR8700266.1 hypothetical protein [Fusobacterium sp. DD45]MBR8710479.1 hypothetical protein [Fusobacterium sp. DD28]MBR8748951.1 hypothetical protein [Fusobacterium sp. DD29]MBR8751071.1 hypothetical protein [Fusobacterium sp. DD26]MBR8761257.1 hypothetical protein [Fusobacterium sp. DD25]
MVRKIKPRKPREIKINETKKVKPAPIPSQAEVQELEARTHLMNLSVVTGKHKAIWDKEIKEHDGYLNPYYRGLIGRVKNLTDKLYEELYPDSDDDDVEVTPYISALMVNYVSVCAPAFGNPIPESKDDRAQRLPAGFMGSISVWAKLISLLSDNRLYPYFIKRKKEEELAKIIDLSVKYMCYLARDIMFKEEMIKSWEANMGRKFEKGRTLDKDFEMVKTKPKKSKGEEFLEKIFKNDMKELDDLEKQNKNRKVEELKMEEKAVEKDIKNVKSEEKTVKTIKNDVKSVEKIKNCDDPVKPSHYVLANGLTAGDVIEFTIKDCKGRTAWKLGTVIKYLVRAEKKAGAIDYQKAQEYINMILNTDYWREELIMAENFREEFEKEYGKSWFSVMYGIAEDMQGGQALALNEVFECIMTGRLEDAKKRIQDVLSFK